YTNMLAFRCRRYELAPEFRRLIFVVPFKLRVARRKVPLLCTRGIFIASDAGDKRVPLVLSKRLLKRHSLQLVCRGYRIMRLVTNSALARFRIDFDDQIEVVMLRRPIAKLQHLRKFVGRVDVLNGKRELSVKRFG